MLVETVFFIIGAVIFIGFFAQLFFEKTKVPDVLILIFTGIILGASLDIFDPALFMKVAPFVGGFAIIIILFDGGINLNLYRVATEVSEAAEFTFIMFLLTTTAVGGIMHFLFSWNFMSGLLLGAAVGGTSSAVVLTTIKKVSAKEKVKTLLSLESAITDALCIVVAMLIIQGMTTTAPTAQEALHSVLSAFSIAVVVAFVFGVFWMGILQKFYGKPFGYLLTMAFAFVLYSAVEYSKANGAISVFVFGLVLGNSAQIAKILKMPGGFVISNTMKSFQTEVTFFVKTFFFVYLGMIFDPAGVTRDVAIIVTGILILIFAARYLATKVLKHSHPEFEKYGTLITTMMPRGLAAAVLASLPISAGMQLPLFSEIVILVVIGTNVITTIGVFYHEKRCIKSEEDTELVAPPDEKSKDVADS